MKTFGNTVLLDLRIDYIIGNMIQEAGRVGFYLLRAFSCIHVLKNGKDSLYQQGITVPGNAEPSVFQPGLQPDSGFAAADLVAVFPDRLSWRALARPSMSRYSHWEPGPQEGSSCQYIFFQYPPASWDVFLLSVLCFLVTFGIIDKKQGTFFAVYVVFFAISSKMVLSHFFRFRYENVWKSMGEILRAGIYNEHTKMTSGSHMFILGL